MVNDHLVNRFGMELPLNTPIGDVYIEATARLNEIGFENPHELHVHVMSPADES